MRRERSEAGVERAPTNVGRSEPETGGDDPAAYPRTESIGLLMRIALFGLRSGFSATLKRHKVPWIAWYYLRVLWEEDGISQRQLTERVGAMQPNTVSALRSMENSGLVRVIRDTADRRQTRVWLTTKARTLMRRVLPEMRAVVREMALVGFTAREEAALRRMLNKVCNNVRRHTPR